MAFNQIVAKTNKLLNKDNIQLISGGSNDQTTNNKQIKLWHLAILIGIPSATVVAYLCYRYYFRRNQNKSNASVNNKKVSQQEKNNAKLTFTPNNNENKVIL